MQVICKAEGPGTGYCHATEFPFLSFLTRHLNRAKDAVLNRIPIALITPVNFASVLAQGACRIPFKDI